MRTVATFSTLGKCWKVTFDLKPVEDWANTATRITSDRFFCELDLNNYPLKIGEWNRIEIIHEEREGNFFFSLSIGGEELVSWNEGIVEQENFSDLKLLLGSDGPAFTRRLLVIEKS